MEGITGIKPSFVINITNKPVLIIGSSYTSDVVYQFHNYILPKMAIIGEYGDKYCLRINDDLDNIAPLEYGKTYSLFDLRIIYLKKILIVYALNGELRVSSRREYAAFGRN